MATNTVHFFQTTNCNTKRDVVIAASMRSGAGTHKSGPRGGQRNYVRDILDEYYSEQVSPDDNDPLNTSQS